MAEKELTNKQLINLLLILLIFQSIIMTYISYRYQDQKTELCKKWGGQLEKGYCIIGQLPLCRDYFGELKQKNMALFNLTIEKWK